MRLVSKILRTMVLTITLSVGIGACLPSLHAATQAVTKSKPIFNQGLKLLKKRQFKKAIEKFTLVISSASDIKHLPALALYHRGLAYQALGKLDESRADYSQAIKLQTLKDSILKVVYYNRGLVHDGMKRPNAALADFNSSIDKDPSFAPAYHNLGNVLRKLGRNNRAIIQFLKSLELGNPQPYLSYMGLALAYEAAGQNKEAITSLKYALSIQPKFQKAQKMLARLTTADLYTFPTQTPNNAKNPSTITGSISPNKVLENSVNKSNRVLSEFERLDQRLRGPVKAAKQPANYKKLALRGALPTSSAGSVVLVVPGPGLEKARRNEGTISTRKTTSSNKTSSNTKFRAQLGTGDTNESARKIWFFLQAQNEDLLQNLKPTIERVDLGKKGIYYRIQAGPLKSLQAVRTLCTAMKKRAVNCFPVKTNG